MHIDLTDTIDADARKAVIAVIDAFNDPATGRPEPSRPLAVLARDGTGTLQGGAWGVSYYDWMCVNLFYLPKALRRQGWGSRIMRAIEREAVRRGCTGIWVDTVSYQAPDFYPRFGFSQFARIDEWVPGQSHIWFQKTGLSGGKVDADLDVDGDPDEADRAVLAEGLDAFSDAIVGPSNRSRLGVLLREAPGEPVTGGLIGRIGRGWLFIEFLALPPTARRSGIGTKMMVMAEAEARARGCRGIWLDTFSWQAQPFYEKLGFRAFGRIENYPGPHHRTFLMKRLDQESAR
jgi:ribosomal protein S18 acetylase RimI-like enzyme